MRAAWRIAIDWLAGRPARTALLTAAVLLASGLIVAVACGIASVNAAFELRAARAVGAADLRVERAGGAAFPRSALDVVQAWPEVRVAAPRAEHALPLRNPIADRNEVAIGRGVDPQLEAQLHPLALVRGRFLRADDEIVPDNDLAQRLDVDVGDTVEVQRFGAPIRLRVVGIAQPSLLGEPIRAPAYVSIRTLGEVASESPGEETLVRIDIALRQGADVDAVIQSRASELPEGLVLRPTERILGNVERNINANRIGFVIVSVMAFLAAAFIILTGLTTGVTERERELAILRCVGAAKEQIFLGQMLVGGWIGAVGGALGVPLGVALAWLATIFYSEQLPAGLRISTLGVAMGFVGSIGAGVGGALAPAFFAARTSPLAALASRARAPSLRSLATATAVALACIGAQVALALSSDDGQLVYWLWVALGAPVLFTGYFLLGVPVTLTTAKLLAPVIGVVLRLPKGLLAGGVAQTPFRYGLTAGSLMAGLAIMVVIWTNGAALLRDWIGAIRFPDAFVHAWRGMTEADRQAVANLPYVEATSAITLVGVQTNAFGVRALRDIGTTFIAFEPEPFFEMTSLNFVDGDLESAKRMLRDGGAILVAREFQVARGLGAGDVFTLRHNDREFDFTIAGVVDSPGIDIAAGYFEIGQERRRLAIHAVFGARADMQRLFGEDAIHLLQIDISDDVDDETAIAGIRQAIKGTLLAAGSGREIKRRINEIGASAMRVMSGVAIVAIVIACFGVGSVIAAGVQGRRFEYGVLRAVGADASLLRRAVLAEAFIIAISACILGTAMGVHAAWMSQRLYQLLAGLDLRLIIAIGPTMLGWGIVAALALVAAAPPALLVAKESPRGLLASRGS